MPPKRKAKKNKDDDLFDSDNEAKYDLKLNVEEDSVVSNRKKKNNQSFDILASGESSIPKKDKKIKKQSNANDDNVYDYNEAENTNSIPETMKDVKETNSAEVEEEDSSKKNKKKGKKSSFNDTSMDIDLEVEAKSNKRNKIPQESVEKEVLDDLNSLTMDKKKSKKSKKTTQIDDEDDHSFDTLPELNENKKFDQQEDFLPSKGKKSKNSKRDIVDGNLDDSSITKSKSTSYTENNPSIEEDLVFDKKKKSKSQSDQFVTVDKITETKEEDSDLISEKMKKSKKPLLEEDSFVHVSPEPEDEQDSEIVFDKKKKPKKSKGEPETLEVESLPEPDDDFTQVTFEKKKKSKKSKNELVQDQITDTPDKQELNLTQLDPKKKPKKSVKANANPSDHNELLKVDEHQIENSNNNFDADSLTFKHDEQDIDEVLEVSTEFHAQDSKTSSPIDKRKRSKKDKTKKDQSDLSTNPTLIHASDSETENVMSKDGTFVNKSDNLTTTGTLLSHERSKDVQIDKFTVSAYGQLLVSDTSISLIHGKRYGLVGENGCGKSTLLKAFASGEVPIQSSVSVFLLEREFDPTEMTAVEAVIELVKTERDELEMEMMELLGTVEGANSARLEYIHERMEELDLSSAAQKARNVLHGLGFTEEMQDMKTKDFSGGWRMRVALARALFVKPTCLLLDDATNHLDLTAVVWLENYLCSYPHTVVLVSHSQDFLNTVCTDIMYLHNKKLEYFSGDYDNFIKVKEELDENLRKRSKADEKKMKKIKENLGRTGKQAKAAKSQEKAMLKRQEKDGMTEIDASILRGHKDLEFSFTDCGGGLPSPFLKFTDVSFNYPGRETLYRNLNFGLDLNSRVALVGPNGAGKSTLMKLMTGDLDATTGVVYRHHHLRIAWFHQHLTEQLDLSMSAVEWLCSEFRGIKPQEMRGIVGKFGLTGKSQVIPMEQLSDGQKRRVLFCWLSKKNAHLLMLDEPTNFLDPETLDALAEAIREFDGGVVLISHDFRLIDQVAEEIWVVEDGTVEEWEGDIRDYKEYLKGKLL